MPPSSERGGRGNPNVEPLAQEHVIAAQVPDHTRFFFHDPNLARLPDGRLVIAAPQWGRARTPDAGTRHLRVLVSDDGGTTWDEAPALPYQEGRPFVLDGRLLMFVQEESHRDFLLVGSDDGGRSWSDPVCVLRGPLWNICAPFTGCATSAAWRWTCTPAACIGSCPSTNGHDRLGSVDGVEAYSYSCTIGSE